MISLRASTACEHTPRISHRTLTNRRILTGISYPESSCSCASYASPAIDTTKFITRAGPSQDRGIRRFVLSVGRAPLAAGSSISQTPLRPSSAGPRFCSRHRSATRSAPAAPRSVKHLVKQAPAQMSLGQQQPVVPSVLDQSPASLHEPRLQARQRPSVDSPRQHEPPPQVAPTTFFQ